MRSRRVPWAALALSFLSPEGGKLQRGRIAKRLPLSLLGRFVLLMILGCGVTAHADVLTELVTQRDWIGYSPRNYNPDAGQQPSQASMRADLQQLYDAGWRRLYNYTLDGNQRHVPRIAKEVGFEQVLAGVFYFDEGQLTREKTNAQLEDQHIDGYLVGNEGLIFGRYSGEQLLAALTFFEGFGKPITTTEVGGVYLQVPELLDVGQFASINIQPWFNGTLDPLDPAAMARAVRDEYVAIKALRPDRLVVIKEAWWPTDAIPYSGITPPPGAATEANQIAFYQALANETDAAGDPLLFMWGESHDQPWKNNEQSPFGLIGPDWGFYEADGTPKAIVTALDDVYTAPYPVNFLVGDFDRDGVVDEADYIAWETTFGASTEIAGSGADGNFDRVIDAADYAVWRDAFTGTNTVIPEPGTATLACLAITAVHFHRRFSSRRASPRPSHARRTAPSRERFRPPRDALQRRTAGKSRPHAVARWPRSGEQLRVRTGIAS